MRFDLSISTSYVPGWTYLEGIREVMQNAIDSNTDGFLMSYKYNEKSQKIIISNEGAVLNKSTLLLGETTKAGNEKMIGEFGEGYKLGTLALLRQGKTISIKNSKCQERWVPSIRAHEKLGKDVLSFEITKTKTEDHKLTFEIGGITPEEWLKVRELFRFTSAMPIEEEIVTVNAKILKGVPGRIYIKGIFVIEIPGFQYGYDFNPNIIQIDRDRKMVNSYDLEYRTSQVWQGAAKEDCRFDEFIRLILMDAKDVKYLENAWVADNNLKEKTYLNFLRVNGDNAYPVLNDTDNYTIEALGKRPVRVNAQMMAFLKDKITPMDGMMKEFKEKIIGVHEDLSTIEHETLSRARVLVEKATPLAFNVRVVTFSDEKVQGLCNPEERLIQIDRRCLNDLPLTLTVLIHEYAHIAGLDQSRDHFNMTEELWKKVVGLIFTQQEEKVEGRKVIF